MHSLSYQSFQLWYELCLLDGHVQQSVYQYWGNIDRKSLYFLHLILWERRGEGCWQSTATWGHSVGQQMLCNILHNKPWFVLCLIALCNINVYTTAKVSDHTHTHSCLLAWTLGTQMLLSQDNLRVSMSQPWLYSRVAHLFDFLIVGQEEWKSQSHKSTSSLPVADFMASCTFLCYKMYNGDHYKIFNWGNNRILCQNPDCRKHVFWWSTLNGCHALLD